MRFVYLKAWPLLSWADSDAAEEMVLLRAYELTIKYSHDRPNGGYAPGEVIMRDPLLLHLHSAHG